MPELLSADTSVTRPSPSSLAAGAPSGANAVKLPTQQQQQQEHRLSGRRSCLICNIRTSCDYCGHRKRKCDGDGARQCSLCKKKRLQCVYSEKRNSSRHGPICNHHGGQESGLVLGDGVYLKRYRFSASCATGLVGMQENALLGDYFRCMGILPLTHPRTVREAMVRIMIATDAPEQGTAGAMRGVECLFDQAGDVFRRWPDRPPPLPNDAAACSFWCTIAVGGLLQGRPRESVAGYICRATDALDCSPAVVTPEVARAWVEMAFVHAFCGNRERFCYYVQLAKTFLDSTAAAGTLDELPMDLVSVIRHAESIMIYGGDYAKSEALHSFMSCDPGPVPEMGGIVSEDDLSRFIMHADRRSGQAFFADLLDRSSDLDPESDCADPGKRGEVNGLRYTWHTEPTRRSRSGHNLHDAMKELMPIYERLEHAVERPHIRPGLGGLIINTALAFSRAAKNDVGGAKERIGRCVEVIEGYPGLCRFETGWLHSIHILVTLLVSMGWAQLYDRLRAIYNPLRRGPPIPPFNEWTGVKAFCSNIHCRALEQVVLSRRKLPSGPKKTEGRDAATVALSNEDVKGGGPAMRSPAIGDPDIDSDWSAAQTSISSEPAVDVGSDAVTVAVHSGGMKGARGVPLLGVVVGSESEAWTGPANGEVGNRGYDKRRGSSVTDPVAYAADLLTSDSWNKSGHGGEENSLAPEDWQVAADTLFSDPQPGLS